jgi:predicted MFS family arabinose efflux permease
MSANEAPETQTSPTRVRYAVLALMALAPASAYLTRILSPFATTLAAEFRIPYAEVGEVMAGFALGYFVFQVPGGMLAASYGVRPVLALLCAAWSGCAFLGSLARSPDGLFWSRVALGVAQAGLVPCCAQVAANWFPVSRRGIVSAVLTSGMQLGAVAATALSARLLDLLGWRHLLQWYALAGIAWAVVFSLWFRDRPEDHPRTNPAECALIREGRQLRPRPPGFVPDVRLPSLAFRLGRAAAACLGASLWAYYAQAFFRAYAYEFFTTWCPAYLEKAYGMTTEAAGELAAWPLVAVGIGGILGGFVVDALLALTGSRYVSRSGTAAVGLGVFATSFAVATRAADPRLAVAILTVGCLFFALSGPATWAAGMDLGGRHTAVIFGLMNMVGNAGAYLSPRQVGRLFDHVQQTAGDWDLVLWLFVGVNAAGALAWVFINPRRSAAVA